MNGRVHLRGLQESVSSLIRDGRLAIIAILLLAAGLRFIDLERVPPGLNVDEALHAYEAYSILRTGRDEWGRILPITFRAFNDYRRPAAIYSAVPFVALYGLTTYAIRAMAAFWGWLAIVLTYRLAHDLFDRWVGLAAALMLTLSSWHVGFSRLGVEASGPLLPTIVTGLLCGWRWYRTRRRSCLYGAALCFGLSLYTYTIAQALTPLLLVAIALVFFRPLREDARGAIAAAAIVAVAAAPLVVAIVTNDVIWNRLDAISVFAVPDTNGWSLALKQWLGHFSPGYLFIAGDASPIHHLQGYGQLYWIELLLAPLGLVRLLRRGAWLAISAVPAALTRQDMGSANSMRGIAGVAAWAIVSGAGLAIAVQQRKEALRLSAIFGGLTLGVLLWNARLVLRDYYSVYPVQSARAFEYGIEQAMGYVIAHEDEVDTIVLTDWISQPHIFAVFYSALDPATFQQTHAPYGDRLSEKLTAWGDKYRVGDVEALYRELEHGLFVARPHMLGDANPELIVLHPDGTPAFKVIRK
ncbi:MAG: glycosyltransferase family 39 protein [Anaerolineae bacterium]|nr:glycosyltransferase family 39 protein [Anaerolineae bacterium]